MVEKGSEVGAHILSGAVFEPRALNELFPDWKELGAPLNTPVTGDDIYVLKSAESATKVPNFFVPKTMHNEGNYIISLGNLCRWLAQQAEGLGVEIYPGFAAQEALIDENGVVRGIVTGDLGVDREGNPKEGYYTPGMELRAKYTLFAEGCRGHIGKQLIKKYNLDSEADAQHYGIGIKEIWDIDPSKHKPGLVVHTAGWPLNDENTGGSFLYHLENNQVFVGLIIDLSYSNPHLSPFDEFQRYKHHPVVKQYLEGGKRVAYGARAICKGGLNSLPKMVFPGGALIGCDLGTLNFAKIKGSHTAMKSGMLAATRSPRPWPPAAKAATSCPATSMRSRPAGCTTNCSAAATSARPSTSSALSAAARSTSSTRTSSAARSPSPCMTTSRTTPA